jgi:hypothetical protein
MHFPQLRRGLAVRSGKPHLTRAGNLVYGLPSLHGTAAALERPTRPP